MYDCTIVGTSPFTYASQQVRPGDNQVRVRTRCPGDPGFIDAEHEVLHIRKCMIILFVVLI